jgi:Rrf2 family nitric oxide-sensitive transcriptional repressor
MRLTNFTDFGLRLLMCLAGGPDRTYTTEEIAEKLGLSRDHLAKIVRRLATSGFVETRRGPRGGLRLIGHASAIRLGDVVRSLEESYPIVECFEPRGGNCSLTRRCRLKGRLIRAEEAFLQNLNLSSLADIASP